MVEDRVIMKGLNRLSKTRVLNLGTQVEYQELRSRGWRKKWMGISRHQEGAVAGA